MSGCSAVGCSNRGDKGFFMKSFPRDPERRAIWALQMKRDNWQPNNNSRLCEIHFDSDQWEKTRQDGTRKLKCNAIPTLFQCAAQTFKQKAKKQRFISPLERANEAPNDKTETLSVFENCSKNRVEKNKNLFHSNSNVKSEAGEESEPNFETDSILFEGRKRSISQSIVNQQRTCTSGIKQVQMKRIATLALRDIENHNPSKIMSSGKEAKAHSSLDLRRNSELFDNINEGDTTKLEDIRCRLCTTKSEDKNYIPIFGESDLAEKISRCLPIIVLSTDRLPLYVCQQCLYNLNVSYKLIIGSIKADSILRMELEKSNKSYGSKKLLDATCKESDDDKTVVKDDPVFSINGPIKCDLCDVSYQDMDLFDEHIESSHLLQWRCGLCDHSFESSPELLAHKRLNHSGQISTCKNCANTCMIEEIGSEVIRIVEKNRENYDVLSDDRKTENFVEKLPDLSCTKCKIIFENAKQFRKHHTIHLPRRLKCSTCLKRCPSLFDYISHMRIFHNQMKRNNSIARNCLHSCKYCKKLFLAKQQLVIHLRKHKKEMLDDPSVTVYKCVTCPKKFVDRALYQKHRNVHDPECWHKFRCYICNRSFMDKFKLKIHQSIHDGVKPYQCDVCGRMFNRNANMIRHRTQHFEQACRHCDKIFKNTQMLREHLKDIHDDTVTKKSNSKGTRGGKMIENKTNDHFICGYCGKQLTSYYSLLDHERIHTGDKPYVCEHCGKSFRSITARWDHVVRHEKGNYICELCGKIMSNKLNLRRHLRKHAAIEQRKFECTECRKLFHVRWRLNAHLMRIHHSGPSN